jgi:ABC-type transport system involved in multi-copper enzyme maturation permease subunit
MRVLVANIEDVMREAAARWTLIAYFFLSTIFILIFASAINLDIVDGALAGAKLFGQEVDMPNDPVAIEPLVVGAQSIFSVILYLLCTFLAVFATAHLVPRMQDKGTIDLYLSRPVGRVKLLFSRYVAGLLLAGSNIVYLMGSMWLIMAWKTGVFNPRLLFAAGIIFLLVAVLLSFAFLIGVVTSSTAVSIMTTYAIFLFGGLLGFHESMAAAVSSEWQAWTIETFYWVLPKSWELGAAVFSLVGGRLLPEQFSGALTPAPFLSTAALGVGCLILASWLFTRKEF